MSVVNQAIKKASDLKVRNMMSGFSNADKVLEARPYFTTESINNYLQKALETDDSDIFNDALLNIESLKSTKVMLKGDLCRVFVTTPLTDEIEKARQGNPIGTLKQFGPKGIWYKKVENGWRPVPKGEHHMVEEHLKRQGHENHSVAPGVDPKATVDKTSAKPSTPHNNSKMNEAQQTKMLHDQRADEPGRKKISVDDRWKSYDIFADMVIDGDHKSLIAYGSGGIGKTFTVQQLLKKKNLKAFDESSMSPAGKIQGEDNDNEGKSSQYDYVEVGGKSTISEMWKTMYEHNGKLIIFDDCDSVFDNPDGVNILKKALDTSGDGTVQYREFKDRESGEFLPKRFKFTGRMIFITNKSAQDFKDPELQPLKSRSLVSDLTMTKGETLQRARTIAPMLKVTDAHGNPMHDVTVAEKLSAIKFLDDHSDEVDISNFNTRTIGSIIKLIRRARQNKDMDWKNIAAQQIGLSHYKNKDAAKQEV